MIEQAKDILTETMDEQTADKLLAKLEAAGFKVTKPPKPDQSNIPRPPLERESRIGEGLPEPWRNAGQLLMPWEDSLSVPNARTKVTPYSSTHPEPHPDPSSDPNLPRTPSPPQSQLKSESKS
jgi:hypothetical protein